MMQGKDNLLQMQRYVANIAISGSTLRNQGAKGVINITRTYLANLDLYVLKKIDNSKYSDQLNEWTDELLRKLPNGAKNWGTARKGINVFMVQAFLNKYLSAEYELQKFADVLETPLDSKAATELQNLSGVNNELPKWKGIKNLSQESSRKYQKFASELAKNKNIPRACLDTILWRADH